MFAKPGFSLLGGTGKYSCPWLGNTKNTGKSTCPCHPIQAFAFVVALVFAGCNSTIDVKFPRDPGGGLLTNSEACLYDFDADGFWYVIFLREASLGVCDHRHASGHHLMLDRYGDMVFYSRCSGRGESIDIMGRLLSLKEGQVFLVTVEKGNAQIVQLPAHAKRFDGNDPAQRADALAALIAEPTVQAFLSSDAQLRIQKDAQAQKQRPQSTK